MLRGAFLASGLLTAACATSEVDDLGGGGEGGVVTNASGGAGGTPAVGGAGGTGGTGGEGGDPMTVTSTSSSGGEGGVGGEVPNTCGNGVLDDGEQCEGSDFGDKTCADFGLSGGTLVCNPYCGIVVSGCTPLESCNDGQDNDLDGLTDCADPECAALLTCTDSCFGATFASIPSYPNGNLVGEPNVLSSSCAPNGGQESVFVVTAPADGDLSIQFTPDFFANFDGTLSVRTTCNDIATEIACVNNSGQGQSETLSVPALAGQTYYIIYESTSPGAGGFFYGTIDQPQPEDFCDNFWDDDIDGFLDCDDPDNCQTSFACTPGPLGYGSSCFQNSQCQATGNDPVCLNWQQGFNNGYCSEFCAGPGDCPAGGVCKDINLSVHGVCFKSCTSPADCPAGTSCVDGGDGQLICDKPPELNCQDYQDNDSDGFEDCEDATACATSFSCTSGPLAAGSSCQLHNQCQANDNDPLCIDEFWSGWPGGYCSQYCDMATSDCPSGSLCSNWFFVPSGNATCLDTCTVPEDCRPGYFCGDVGLASNVCIY